MWAVPSTSGMIAGVRSKAGGLGHAAAEAAADDALDHDGLPDSDIPPGEVDGEPSAHARAGRERSTSPSAKMQTLRLWASAPCGGPTNMVP